jgi:hypothetical protein
VRPGWRSMMTTFDLVTARSFPAGGLFNRPLAECTDDLRHEVK